MHKYKFCVHGSDEAISIVQAESIDEARITFADLKKLPLLEFLKIYHVMKADEKNLSTER